MSNQRQALVSKISAALVGDVAFINGDKDALHHPPGIAAAVLIAITDRPAPGIILTQRPNHMRRHPGQIAFPGGRIDPEDADAVAAALREAYEEITLDPGQVQVIGVSDPYHTVTGYLITPIIGLIPADLPLAANPDEVEEIFEVPLAHVLHSINHVERIAEVGGKMRHFYEIVWQNRRIWGATSGILVNLARRLGCD